MEERREGNPRVWRMVDVRSREVEDKTKERRKKISKASGAWEEMRILFLTCY